MPAFAGVDSNFLPALAIDGTRGRWVTLDPLGLCLKFGGGSFTFADTPRELEKGSESAGECVSQCISCGLPLVYTSHMLPNAALGSPSHLPP